MPECLNAVGFVFNSVKTYIKKDKNNKYVKCNCQECNYLNSCNNVSVVCSSCKNNSCYKICIFKLKKENFVSSSLDISTSLEDAWDTFKRNIIYQKNGNFVISVTKNNKLHSFYANMIKAKKCKCCDSILLYFKYNVISDLTCYNQFNYNYDNILYDPYLVACANINSNIFYDLKSCEYQSIRFFNSSYYSYRPSLDYNKF